MTPQIHTENTTCPGPVPAPRDGLTTCPAPREETAGRVDSSQTHPGTAGHVRPTHPDGPGTGGGQLRWLAPYPHSAARPRLGLGETSGDFEVLMEIAPRALELLTGQRVTQSVNIDTLRRPETSPRSLAGSASVGEGGVVAGFPPPPPRPQSPTHSSGSRLRRKRNGLTVRFKAGYGSNSRGSGRQRPEVGHAKSPFPLHREPDPGGPGGPGEVLT